jgi:hypothetical protein
MAHIWIAMGMELDASNQMNPIATVAFVAGSIFVPTLIALGALLLYRKWQDREGRRSPIADRRLHGPGEQLRKRIDEHDTEVSGSLTALFFVGPYFIAIWAMTKLDWSQLRFRLVDGIFILAFLAIASWAIRKIIRHAAARRRCIAGLKAELYTAQELNRLLGAGCTVLHDVPGEKFNIDHVVIGPRAVYMVETKSVRKPKAVAGARATVVYDGESLRFPDHVNRKALAQAQQQAQWLGRHLQQATKRTVPVVATVALPGWWIDTSRGFTSDAVRVFNPAGRGAQFMGDRGAHLLDAGTIALVTQALVMRYPVES